MVKTREHRYFINGKHKLLCAGSVGPKMSKQDKGNPIYLKSNWTIVKENLNTYLLFKLTEGYNDDRFVSSNVLYHNGSPKFGCVYEYVDCEQYNYSIIYNYKTRILSSEKTSSHIILRDKYGYTYYIENNKNNIKIVNKGNI